MGAAASAPRQPLRELSADGVRDLVESLGPKFVDLAKQLQENGYDGEVLADASDEDLDELFGELSVSKLQQKVLRNKLRKSLDERPAAPAVGLAGEGLLGVAKDLPWVAPVAFLIGAVVKAAQDAAALKEDAARFVRVVRSVEGALQRAAADGNLTENASIREALEEALAHCHMLAREGTCVAMLLSDSATFEALQAKLHSACEACAADTNLLVSESYDQATRLAKEIEALGGAEKVAADPKLRERLTASLSAADQGIEVTAVAAPVEYVVEAYDCFLSHKRSDCQDLVARVHDRLTDAGYRVFIDREDLEELPKLKASVRASQKLVFFMSPKIFESDWCMLELCTAVDSGVDVLPVTVEGTTWGNGERVFPDAQIDVPESVEIQGQTYYPRAAAAKAFAHAIGLEHVPV